MDGTGTKDDIGAPIRDGIDDRWRTTLDDAWAEAEAALPDEWRLWSLTYDTYDEPRWRAIAGVQHDDGRAPLLGIGDGPTPAAALQTLAARLRESR